MKDILKDEKKQRKASLTDAEWNEVQNAMDKLGVSRLSDYIMETTRSVSEQNGYEKRMAKRFQYRHAKLCTLRNQMLTNVNFENARDEFVKEVELICQDLLY